MQVAAHQRFATRKSNAIDSKRRTDADNAFDFFKREQVLLWHELNIVRRHAIKAANVTTIRHADSQIVVQTPEAIDQPLR